MAEVTAALRLASATPGCGPRCGPGSSSSASRAAGWSRRLTPSAGTWKPSWPAGRSGGWRSRPGSSSASKPRPRAPRRAAPAGRWPGPRSSCAISPTASAPPPWSRVAWPPRSRAGRAGPPDRDLTVPARLPPAIEGALYFVCSEALANIAKHAQGDSGLGAVTVERGDVVARLVDDGRGGADPRGSGLRGLADRVEALGGELQSRDRTPGGTALVAGSPSRGPESGHRRRLAADPGGSAPAANRCGLRDRRHGCRRRRAAPRGCPGRPDAVIVDIRMPPGYTDEGIRAAHRLRRTHRRSASWCCRSTSRASGRCG